MARSFKPTMPFNVAMRLLIPTYTTVKGVDVKTFNEPSENDPLIFGSFRTFGGNEAVVNDVYTIEDTGVIDTWYRPDIKADCRVYMCDTGQTWEIANDPENINMRNQFLQFKVRKIGGGV